MSYQTFDLIFPFFVMGYGFLVTVVLNLPPLVALAEERLSPMLLKQLMGHRLLAITCLLVGGVWSLQTLWLGTTF